MSLTRPETSASGPAAPPSLSRRAWRLFRRAWPVLRYVLGLALVALAVDVLLNHQSELSGISSVFGHLHWWWFPVALVVEALSYLAFAIVQYQLLAAGRLRAPFRPLYAVTLAAQAVNNSLPGGAAFALVYGFRWYRRFGADEGLAAWTMVGTMVAASVSLTIVAAAGLAIATEQGATLDLIPVVIGALAVTVAIGVIFVYERPLTFLITWSLHFTRRVVGRPRGDLAAYIDRVIRQVTVVRLDWRQIVTITTWAVANWVLDCGCFALSFLVVGAGIPWKGLLLAYGAGQLAATLPITPGGLGVVEGSITIALVAFGGSEPSVVAAVLIYRLISFWIEIPVGVLSGGWLALGVRRGRWPRHVLRKSIPANGISAEGGRTPGEGGEGTDGPSAGVRLEGSDRQPGAREAGQSGSATLLVPLTDDPPHSGEPERGSR
jgi:putative heme transporter